MKIKSCELTGTALDWAVATAEQASIEIGMRKQVLFDTHEDDAPAGVSEHDDTRWQVYNPSENWAQAGPIIERVGIEMFRNNEKSYWFTSPSRGPSGTGETPLLAAMRGYVRSTLGDEVEIPEELQDAAH